jgi:uncharacterized protein YndB with AHSA1/START domain
MTRQKSFKQSVRARMEKTGESYSEARRQLLAKAERRAESATVEGYEELMSDEAIRRRTGKRWGEWFAILDASGAVDRKHGEIAAWLSEKHGVDGWSAQSLTVGYERARGLRASGERPGGGFSATASKTIAVPVERLFETFTDESERRRWLPDGNLRERTSTSPKSARFDWEDGSTRVIVGFEAKGDAKSLVALEHERLPDADSAEEMKAFWRERLTALKERLEA